MLVTEIIPDYQIVLEPTPQELSCPPHLPLPFCCWGWLGRGARCIFWDHEAVLSIVIFTQYGGYTEVH